MTMKQIAALALCVLSAYLCRVDCLVNKENSVSTCQGGEIQLVCKENDVIHILDGFYGRKEKPSLDGVFGCTSGTDLCTTNQNEPYKTLWDKCSNRQTCTLLANDASMKASGCYEADKSKNYRKYLHVKYRCAPKASDAFNKAVADAYCFKSGSGYNWGKWWNSNKPSDGSGDLEERRLHVSLGACQNAVGMQAQTSDGKSYTSTDDILRLGTDLGLSCSDDLNTKCKDYKVRYCCKTPEGCNHPGDIENGVADPSKGRFSVGDKVTYDCKGRYSLIGADELTCVSADSWSAPVPECQGCKHPGQIQDGFVFPRNRDIFGIGERAVYRCKTGYQLTGIPMLLCLTGSIWSGPLPTCLGCSHPGRMITNGYIPDKAERDRATFPVGGTITYACDKGYTLNGSVTLECNAVNSWSAALPTCEKEVPKDGSCKAFGDPHYYQFDSLEKRQDFMGLCTYVLSETCTMSSTDKRWFSVLTVNENRGNVEGVSWVKHVIVKLPGNIEIILKNYRGIEFNGREIESLSTEWYFIRPHGRSVILKTDYGLRVAFNGNGVTVTLDKSLRGKVCGICGNFNGDSTDDLVMRNGRVGKDFKEMAISYKTDNKCEDMKGDVPCDPEDRSKADTMCNVLFVEVIFKRCHEIVPVNGYYEACITDVCAYRGDMQVYLQILVEYADTCGLCGWRSMKALNLPKPACPRDSTFTECARPCANTCANPDAASRCVGADIDICVCNPGFLLQGDRCIPASDCGCDYFGGITYRRGATFPGRNKGTVCNCTGLNIVECVCKPGYILDGTRNGVINCRKIRCSDCDVNAVCIVNGDAQCVCERGFTGDGLKCDPICIKPKIPTICVPNCPRTCKPLAGCIQSCLGKGCVCPPDMVQIGIVDKTCVKPEDCPKDEGICKAFGDPHYFQFDSVQTRRDFMGNCTYTLAESCFLRSSDERWFAVLTENENRGNVEGVSWVKRVIVKLPGNTEIVLYKDHVVTYNGDKITELFVSQKDSWYKVQHAARSSILTTDNGLRVAFNGNGVTVTLSNSYEGEICGICGNYNGDSNDDLAMRDGRQADDFVELAESYNTDEKCFDTKDKTPCDPDDRREAMRRCNTLRVGVFVQCHAIIGITGYFESCVVDMCAYKNDLNIFITILEEYADSCGLCGWRKQVKLAPRLCPLNSVFVECAPPCHDTCTDPGASSSCTGKKVDACVCSRGYLLEGDKCVLRSECGCTYNGISFAEGEKISTIGNSECTCIDGRAICRCKPGYVEDDEGNCIKEEQGLCKAFGDPHYFQFDSVTERQDFMGNCSYRLAETCGLNPSDPRWFSVQTENENRGGVLDVSWVKRVIVKLPGNVEIVLLKDLVVMVNGQKVAEVTKDLYQIRRRGRYTVVITKHGLRVAFNGNGVNVHLSPSYKGQICGICGNYNDDSSDDLVMENGITAGSFKQYAESFKTDDSCPETDQKDPCTGKEKAASRRRCTILRRSIFAKCRKKLNILAYFQACVIDDCAYKGDIDVFIQILAEYADDCGLCGWRRILRFKPMECPANSKFQDCANPCPNTCTDPRASEKCTKLTKVDACVCEPGYLLDGNKCVASKECGCVYQGLSIAKGDEFFISEERRVCTCLGMNKYECKCETGYVEVDGVCVKESEDKEGECKALGDPHYFQFDSVEERHDFMGNCTYRLVEACDIDKSDRRWFSVLTENEHRGDAMDVTWVKRVIVHLPGDIKVVMDGNHVVSVNNHRVSEVKLDWYTINPAARSTVLMTNYGLRVAFNGDAVRVRLKNSYAGKVCGICGNFNGNNRDDLVMENGLTAKNFIEFAESHEIGDDCKDTDLLPLDCSDREKKKAEDLCSILKDPIFRRCPVDVTGYYDACVIDVCAYKGAQWVLIKIVAEYAESCGNCIWRSFFGFPPFTCGSNSEFVECASPCTDTCANPKASEMCKEAKRAACVCKPGYVVESGVCIKKSQCGCSMEGLYFPLGEKFSPHEGQECKCIDSTQYNCICLPGYEFQDSKCIKIVEVGICKALGDPHYFQFDNAEKRQDFMGNCTYRLVEACRLYKDDDRWFSVLTENENRGGIMDVSWVKRVIVHLPGGVKVVMDGKHVSYVNDQLVSEVQKPLYTLNPAARSTVLNTRHGLRVGFNGDAVRVTLNGAYKGQVCGICGNFNNNSLDDLKMESGFTAKNFIEFAESHQVGDDCVKEDMKDPDCSDEQRKKAEEMCNILKHPIFRKCTVNVTGYYESCVTDVCAYKGEQWVLIQIITEFAKDCDICTWRRLLRFPPLTCPSNSIYDECASPCTNTCANPKATEKCVGVKRAACVCKPGYLQEGHICIRASKCGCLVDGHYLPMGQKFSPDPTQVCQCLSQNMYTCVCKPGYEKVNSKCIWKCVKPKVYTDCVSTCPDTCDTVAGVPAKCTKSCAGHGCVCPIGMVQLSKEDTTCVKPEDCPDEEGICKAFGDPHYFQFDSVEKRQDFMGNCTYILAEQCGMRKQDPRWFSVQTENENRGGNMDVSWVKRVIIELPGNTKIVLDKDHKVTVNSVNVAGATNDKFHIWHASRSSILQTARGLRVAFNGNGVTVRLSNSYKFEICGICGNFNDDPTDDNVMQSGTQAANFIEMAKSYKVEADDVCADTDVKDPCSERDRKKAVKMCDVLLVGVLKQCHSTISVTGYYESCIIDVCAYKGDKKYLNAVIIQYAEDCGLCGWRTLLGIEPITCGPHSTYTECTQPCQGTCLQPNVKCGGKKVDACVCDDGYLLDGDICMPEAECGCVFNGLSIPLGGTFSRDVGTLCTCKARYSVTCVCKPGFKLFNEKCVPECTPPEIFTTCKSPCPKTCDNYDTIIICPKICEGPGCVCPDDMVQRSDVDDTCVKIADCPKRCIPPKVFTPCVSACPATCENYNKPIVCPTICLPPGCVCPVDMVQISDTDDTCVKIADCPEPVLPDEDGVCKAFGDPHYFQFDSVEKRQDFMGNCTYRLTEACDLDPKDERWFSVRTENENRDGVEGVSWVKKVSIKLPKGVEIIFEGNHVVYLNGYRINDVESSWYTVRPAARSSVLQTTYGLRVAFNGNGVTVTVDKSYAGKVCGICGNFNNNPNDDLIMENGVEAENFVQFARSHQVGDDCIDIKEPDPPCTDEDRAKAVSMCSILIDGTIFKKCRDIVPVNGYYESCITDVCAYKGSINIFLEAVAQYAKDCGICGWRSLAGFKPLSCGPNSSFKECVGPCADTCAHPKASENCNKTLVDSCVCDSGYLRAGDKCIPESQCGCSMNGISVSTGSTFMPADGKICKCTAPKTLLCKCDKGYEVDHGDCIRQCKPPMMYNPCVRDCPKTCNDLEGKDPCSRKYLESLKCVCPDGMVQVSRSDRTCVKPSECRMTCKPPTVATMCVSECPKTCLKNYAYPDFPCSDNCDLGPGCECPSDMSQLDLVDKTCVKTYECPKRATCVTWGSHYITFNGRTNDFEDRACTYILAHTHLLQKSDPRWFSITSEAGIGGRKARIRIASWDILIEQDRIVKVNSVSVADMSSSRFGIRHTVSSTIVIINTGVQLEFDGRAIFVKVPSTFMNEVTGMCGYYGENLKDGLKMQDGKVASSFAEFAMANKVGICEIPSPMFRVSCSSKMEKRWSRKKFCGAITSSKGPFGDCHEKMDLSSFYNWCQSDSCAADSSQSVYETLLVVVAHCRDNGFSICNWRDTLNLYKPTCPENSILKCTVPCQNTCQYRNAASSCVGTVIEDCVCNEGYFKEGSSCIKESECGCIKNGYYFKKGSKECM